ncbi:MAG TPA: hypothetical protein VGE72_08330 [Azospirillum sp.]
MQARPRQFEQPLSGAERARLHRERQAERKRNTASLIAELYHAVPADVAKRLAADERYKDIIMEALLGKD